ncbi:hypothetical protein [Asticcacaulis sp. EMRT-3]|uniref:hypothetical protein n=1 Tax=Asticcacaulis sp. EMRT-3 TaxID=3040349 RepID=UPI0024AF715D|nr:hypothetical protein [Asticcacaulis sp. EMRT-3]MDI7773737.1 hypothetical protein [Asticcacaulis sp. EMRT-3]
MKTQKTTKSLIATAALIAAVATSLTVVSIPATASAAPMHMHPVAVKMDMRASAQIDGRIHNLRNDIREGQRTRHLSQREANRLTSQLNSVASLKRSYDRHGLTRSEIATLNGKLDVLNGRIHVQANDRNRR